MKLPLSPTRIKKAFVIAAVADAIQFPLFLTTLTGILTIPSELLDIGIDLVVMFLVIRLLGFHWFLLPALFLEFIPSLDLIPTWTACVAYIVSQQNPRRSPPSAVVVVDAEVVQPAPPLLTTSHFGQTNKNT